MKPSAWGGVTQHSKRIDAMTKIHGGGANLGRKKSGGLPPPTPPVHTNRSVSPNPWGWRGRPLRRGGCATDEDVLYSEDLQRWLASGVLAVLLPRNGTCRDRCLWVFVPRATFWSVSWGGEVCFVNEPGKTGQSKDQEKDLHGGYFCPQESQKLRFH